MYNIKSKNLSSFVECQQWSTNKVVSTSTKYDLNRRNYTSAIYYIWAKIGKYFLKDIDILPLQGLSWQTSVVVFSCLYNRKMFRPRNTVLTTRLSFSFKILQLTWTTLHENTQLMVTNLSSCPLES